MTFKTLDASEYKNLSLDKDYLDRDMADKIAALDNLTREKNTT